MGPHSWPRLWQFMIARPWSSEGDHCGGVGLRWNVSEVILARDIGVPATRNGTKPDADSDLIVAMKSETPCEPELMLFAGMNDHLHAAGLLEPLRNGEPTPKKIWAAIQTFRCNE